jgi:exonuclease I
MQIFLMLEAVGWFGYGLLCLLYPSMLARVAGVGAHSMTGLVELSAMYGGLEAAIGIIAFLGWHETQKARWALWSLVLLCGGMGGGRLLAALFHMHLSLYTAGALLFELGSATVAWIFLSRLPLADPGITSRL